MKNCPICDLPMCRYKSGEWTEYVCWSCGHYESNSPAFRHNPEMFKNIVRENPSYFLKKFLKLRVSDENLQHNESDEDFTEPGPTQRILHQLRERHETFG